MKKIKLYFLFINKIYKLLCDILDINICYFIDNFLTLNIPNKEST
jgi:hypothetical protein